MRRLRRLLVLCLSSAILLSLLSLLSSAIPQAWAQEDKSPYSQEVLLQAVPSSFLAVPVANAIPEAYRVPQIQQTEGNRSMAFAPSDTQIMDGGFEYGFGYWTTSDSWGIIIRNDIPASMSPHGGYWLARLGRYSNTTSYFSQTVTLPAQMPILSYWSWITSSGDCGYHDRGEIRINSTTVQTLDLCEANATTGWVKQIIDLRAYAGQTVSLQFRAETDKWDTSILYIDDVSLGSLDNQLYVPLIAKNYNSM